VLQDYCNIYIEAQTLFFQSMANLEPTQEFAIFFPDLPKYSELFAGMSWSFTFSCEMLMRNEGCLSEATGGIVPENRTVWYGKTWSLAMNIGLNSGCTNKGRGDEPKQGVQLTP
jgi:hypothetical protein